MPNIESMKKLFFIRHAKSSWDDFSLADHDRPLNDRGSNDAPRMGKYLLQKGIHIDLFYSSTAKRAKTTAQLIKESMNSPADIKLEKEFYTFSDDGDIFFKFLKKLSNEYDSVACFGHNETLRILAYRLSKGKVMEFPTCSCIAVTFDINSWEDIKVDNAIFDFFVKPKMLKH